jgi:CubicO group peptidase (beta-lactamase class C family)
MITLAAQGILDTSVNIGNILAAIPEDKADITIKQLLTHSSGLPAHRPFYRKWFGNTKKGSRPQHIEIIKEVLEEPLEYPPGTRTLYSDLGYMLLACLIEKVTRTPFADYVRDAVLAPLKAEHVMDSTEVTAAAGYTDIAPSGICPFENRLIQGEVNDLNARSMGGFSGHAGLFGSAQGLLGMLSKLLDIYHGRMEVRNIPREILSVFWTKDMSVAKSTWALGFDTPSPQGSSAGRFFSEKSVGHLGFTGTSFWIDTEKDIIVVFLSNRTFPRATEEGQEAMRRFRPKLHDLVMEALK